MADNVLTVTVDPSGKFRDAVAEAKKILQDLKEPLQAIADDFYEGQEENFERSPSPYQDLDDLYKDQKQKSLGFVYPVLVAHGKLRDAASKQGAPGNITTFTKDSVKMGVSESSLPYANAHQYGTDFIPARPYIFVGPESPYASASQRQRVDRWTQILFDFVKKTGEKSGVWKAK